MLKTPRRLSHGAKSKPKQAHMPWHSAIMASQTHYAGVSKIFCGQVFRLGFSTAVSGLLT